MIRERSERLKSVVGIFLVLALGAAFLWEVLSLAGVPIARDMQLFFVPQKRLLWDALQAGRLPLWTPLLGSGTPLFANFQSGAFYPPNWIYAVVPFFVGFNGLLVFHFLLGGAFTYLFARTIELGRASACAAAIAYMLGGYFASLTNLLNVLQVAAWAPAVCWSMILHLKTRSSLSFALLILIYWLAFMAGEPLTFALAAALGLGYAAVWCWRRASRRGFVVLVASFALACVLVGGLSAVQVLPTAEYVAESDRAGGLAYEEAERYHLEPIRLVNLAVPPSYGDPVYRFGRKAMLVTVEPWLFSVYLGAVALILIAAARSNRERRAESLYWAVVGVIGLLLSLGDATPLFPWLYRHLPGFSSFRFPERFLFLTGFSAAMLVANGLEALRAVRRPVRLDGVLGAAALLALIGARIAWWALKEPLRAFGEAHLAEAPFVDNFDFAHALWAGSLTRVLVLVAAALLLVALYRRSVLRESVVVIGLLGLLALDLWIAHRHLTPVADRSFYEDPPVLASVVPFDELRTEYRYQASPFGEDITRFHTLPGLSLESEKWMWQQTVQPNLGVLHGILTLGSGDAIHLTGEVERSTFLAMLPDRDRWRVLQLASVRWVYSFLDFHPELYDARVRLASLPGFVYEVRDPLLRAYVAEQAILVDEKIEALNATLAREFDPHRQVALLAAQAGDRAQAGNRTGATDRTEATGQTEVTGAARSGQHVRRRSARILSDTGTEVRVAVSPSAPGYLVLTDAFYPGWTARVDGQERPILLANYFYRAVAVEPGEREVVFAYRSRPFEIGRRISAATLLATAVGFGVVGVAGRRRRRGYDASAG
ncbi:MAG: YfhO family protein [Gemmatimonadetes bacterium]|nr:YfhO family protein [Gemmatimonadota bacterium]